MLTLETSNDPINNFSGDYDWLSNFYPVVIYYSNFNFKSVEHAFVAAKSTNFVDRQYISLLGPHEAGKAKRAGRKFELRDNWEELKVSYMKRFLYQKFGYAELKQKLLATGDHPLIEGNYWHDNYWGDCYCGRIGCADPGRNQLGKLLEEIRKNIK